MSLTADQLWDALRDVACTTGRKANCIVMLRKHDVEKAVARFRTPPCTSECGDFQCSQCPLTPTDNPTD